jgi:hypothetical protein
MFLLPVDKTIPPTELPPGKSKQTNCWNLTVNIQPGLIKNQEQWCPGEDHSQFHNHTIMLEIFFGNKCLLKTRVDKNQIVFSKNIPDTEIPNRQNLIIKLSGKPVDLDLELDHHVTVKFNVTIENLPVMALFEKHGHYQIDNTNERKMAGEFMGENGQQILEIYTPIYVWLLEHQQFLK